MSTEATNPPWTILRLLNWTKDYLAARGVEQPRLAAELLLAHVLGCPRLQLYTQFEHAPTPQQLADYRALIQRAAQREPIAYLVGHREFYSLDLLVTPDVLIPRPETELLAQAAIDHLRSAAPGAAYWDACTGSGAVAVAVAKHAPSAAALASDVSEAALAVARRNVERHKLAERVTLAAIDLLNLPDALAGLAPFAAITANPPYVRDAQMGELPPEVRAEPATALRAGPEGLDCIRPILQQAPARLAPGGLLAVEIGYDQSAAVWEIVQAVDGYERASFVRDGAGIERVLVAYRKAQE